MPHLSKITAYLLSADYVFGRLLCALIYACVYDYAFENFVVFFFYYIGIEYVEMTVVSRLACLCIIVFPVFFYKGVKDISSFISFFIYLFVYVPFIHSLFVMSEMSLLDVSLYSLALCAFQISCFYVRSDRPLFKSITTLQKLSLRKIEIITLFLTIALMVFRASSMHFVNFFTESQLLYELRTDNSEALGDHAISAYIKGWLSGAFYPFLMVCYLRCGDRYKTAAVFAGYIALFMMDMQKLTFFLPFFLLLFYLLVNSWSALLYKAMHSSLILIICSISLILYVFKDNELVFGVGAIFLLRTVCVSGWLTQSYLLFFQQNPYTYYSHIGIVNAITGAYPYNEPLGITVAYGFQNSNANFLLTDGLAAWGIMGILLIGVFFCLFMHFLNAITKRYRLPDVIVICLPALSYFLNVSIFTVMLTDGMLILLLLLLCGDTPLTINNAKDIEAIR